MSKDHRQPSHTVASAGARLHGRSGDPVRWASLTGFGAVALGAVLVASFGLSPVAAQDNRVGVNPPVTFVEDPGPTSSTTNVNSSTSSSGSSTSSPSAISSSTAIPSSTGNPGATTSSPTVTSTPVDASTSTVTASPSDTGPVRAGHLTSTSLSPVLAPGASTTVPKSTAPKSTDPAPAVPAKTVSELQLRIDALLAPVPGVAASISLDGVGPVYARNADRGSIPASTQKIFTIGAALLRLGGDQRFITEIRSSTLVDGSGVLVGDLVVRASGDPSFSTAGVNALVDAAVRAGIKTVAGDLVVYESHVDSLRTNDGWKASFTPGEVGSLSAFSVNGNHQGGKGLLDPGTANLGLVRAALLKRGVVVRGIDRPGVLPLGGPVLGSVPSATLRELAAYALKKSENTYAELLLKELGASAGNGSSAGGIEMVRQQFAAFGVSPPVMADGSGLSSLNRSTTAQQVAWLSKLRSSKVADDFRAALPVACVDGTLKNRLCKTPGSGKVQAKTGTLDNVTALSGYATTPSGRVATFSFIGNGLSSTSRARAAIDQALIQVLAATLP